MQPRFPEAVFQRTGRLAFAPPPKQEGVAPNVFPLARDGELYSELLTSEDMEGHLLPWSRLAARAIESNGFFEPSVLLPAARHLAGRGRVVFLTIWVGHGVGRELRALVPLAASSLRGTGQMVRVWRDPQFVLGTPLIAKADAARTVRLLLLAVRRAAPGAAGLAIDALAADGPTATLFRAACPAMWDLERHERACVVLPAIPGAPAPERKQRKEMARLGRRLAERGPIRWEIAATPDETRLALERFLLLEAMGWKGGRATALMLEAGRATFVRMMVRRLALEDKVRIISLFAGERLAASGIVILSGAHGSYWKTAYDEGLAATSPGVQLSAALPQLLAGTPGLALIDSCAIANHPMIDRLWPGRRAIVDVFLPLGAATSSLPAHALWRERMRRRLRLAAKAALVRVGLR